MNLGMRCQNVLDRLALVRREVVGDDVDLFAARLVDHNVSEEGDELGRGVGLSLAVSLSTMLMGFARYSRDCSFGVIGRNRRFILFMAAGSLAGAFAGGLLLGVVLSAVLLPTLAVILLVSAIKIWRHA